MTDSEFDVLDELYFIQTFDQLLDQTGMSTSDLITTLEHLRSKGWIKVFRDIDVEEIPDQIDLRTKAGAYYFLASKSGLKAHNS